MSINASFKNSSALVKARLIEGQLSYKAIANEARKTFVGAMTTDKSVASIARDMRKVGKLEVRLPKGNPPVEVHEQLATVVTDDQLDMFKIFEEREFQLTLI
jgi:hypothetical protein